MDDRHAIFNVFASGYADSTSNTNVPPSVHEILIQMARERLDCGSKDGSAPPIFTIGGSSNNSKNNNNKWSHFSRWNW